MRSPGLTRRVVALAAGAAAIATVLGAAVPAVVLGLKLDARESEGARQRAAAAARGLELEMDEHSPIETAVALYLAEAPVSPGRIEVWSKDRLLGSTGDGPPVGFGPEGSLERRPNAWVARAPGPEGTLVVASVPRVFTGQLRWEVGIVAALTLPLAALLAGAASALLLARGLAPLRALAEDVAATDPKAPFTPLPLRSADREVALLTRAVNASGARMFAALKREGEFAAHAAHALRTPLTRLSALVENDPGPLRRSVAELGRLVDGLLLLVRTGTPIAEAGFTVNLADVAREAVARERLPEDEVSRLTVDAPDEALVRGDETLLLAAVEHLLDNALRYTRGGSAVRVEVVEVPGANEVSVSVLDEGPGPDPASLEELFAPFARGVSAAGREGTGIGLALVRRVAEAHGGSATARREGPGTRFEIRIPAWRASTRR